MIVLQLLMEIKKYVRANNNAIATPSFGRIDYLHLLKYSEAIVGNSSSGILEAPYLGIPTIDIGKRQKGRSGGDSIFRSSPNVTSITATIKRALESSVSKNNHIYEGKNSIKKVLNILEKTELLDIKLKSFVDVR